MEFDQVLFTYETLIRGDRVMFQSNRFFLKLYSHFSCVLENFPNQLQLPGLVQSYHCHYRYCRYSQPWHLWHGALSTKIPEQGTDTSRHKHKLTGTQTQAHTQTQTCTRHRYTQPNTSDTHIETDKHTDTLEDMLIGIDRHTQTNTDTQTQTHKQAH